MENQDFLDSMREHITEQLGRISEENEARARLLQEEIDRRFAALRDLVDERRDNSQRALQWLQGELERRIGSLGLLYTQRHDDLKELMLIGQESARAAVQAALESANETNRKSEAANDKRFDGVNEFRKALSDQTGTFIPRAEFDAQVKGLADRMTINAERMTALELRLTSRLDTAGGREAGSAELSRESREARTEQRLSQNTIVSVIVALVIATGVVISILTYAHR